MQRRGCAGVDGDGARRRGGRFGFISAGGVNYFVPTRSFRLHRHRPANSKWGLSNPGDIALSFLFPIPPGLCFLAAFIADFVVACRTAFRAAFPPSASAAPAPFIDAEVASPRDNGLRSTVPRQYSRGRSDNAAAHRPAGRNDLPDPNRKGLSFGNFSFGNFIVVAGTKRPRHRRDTGLASVDVIDPGNPRPEAGAAARFQDRARVRDARSLWDHACRPLSLPRSCLRVRASRRGGNGSPSGGASKA